MDCCHKLRLPTTLFVSFALLFFFFISLVFFVVGKEDVMFKLISIISIHYAARVWLALQNPTWRCLRSLTVVVNITGPLDPETSAQTMGLPRLPSSIVWSYKIGVVLSISLLTRKLRELQHCLVNAIVQCMPHLGAGM